MEETAGRGDETVSNPAAPERDSPVPDIDDHLRHDDTTVQPGGDHVDCSACCVSSASLFPPMRPISSTSHLAPPQSVPSSPSSSPQPCAHAAAAGAAADKRACPEPTPPGDDARQEESPGAAAVVLAPPALLANTTTTTTSPEQWSIDSSSLRDPEENNNGDTGSASSVSSSPTNSSIDDNDDADSALSPDPPSSTVSATSSVFHFIEAHGRTWHRYHSGKYYLPNDMPEQERLDLQHDIFTRLFDNRLHLAPLSSSAKHSVLDLGTGTGIWAIDFADAHPASSVLGTDLSPIQPAYVPPNCRFQVDDAEDAWTFTLPFDFIHARCLGQSLYNPSALFASCFANLRPGGWVEFHDYYLEVQPAEGCSLEGTALLRWNQALLEAVRRKGTNPMACALFADQMRDAGFVDVVERRFALPGNAWRKEPNMKLLGAMQMENIAAGLHGFSIRLLTQCLGWMAEEVEVLLMEVRKDLRNTKNHFYWIVYAVYGRKP